jgi:hypothetical protein
MELRKRRMSLPLMQGLLRPSSSQTGPASAGGEAAPAMTITESAAVAEVTEEMIRMVLPPSIDAFS